MALYKGRSCARPIFGLLICKFTIDCPLYLTCFLQELGESSLIGIETRSKLTVVPALFTDFLKLCAI